MSTDPLGLYSGAVPIETWWLPRPPLSRYPGGFPRHFEAKLYATLGNPQSVVHLFGGRAEFGTRVDINPELAPDVLADAHELPFSDEAFEVAVCDPPYSDEESRDIYGTGPLRRTVYMREAVRVASRYVVTYHAKLQPRPAGAYLIRVIVILTRPNHSARICQIWRKQEFPEYVQEKLEF